MQAKTPKAPQGRKPAPFGPLSPQAAPAAAPAPDNRLSGAFAAALGKSAARADIPPASAGKDKTRGGAGRPGEINKAGKPPAGMNAKPPRRSGHR